MNPLLATSEIEKFLNTFPSKNRRRGQFLFEKGAVSHLGVENGKRYSARVVCTFPYHVTLVYEPNKLGWSSQCSCGGFVHCQHAYAGMLALQANAEKLGNATSAKAKGNGAKKTGPKTVKVREEPQPPRSALYDALTQALGRKLDRAEGDYVQRVQWLQRQVANGYSFTAEMLRQLCP